MPAEPLTQLMVLTLLPSALKDARYRDGTILDTLQGAAMQVTQSRLDEKNALRLERLDKTGSLSKCADVLAAECIFAAAKSTRSCSSRLPFVS